MSNDRMDALSPEAELFYRRLMSVADDYGRAEGEGRLLRSNLCQWKTDRITQEENECWLAEYTHVLPREEGPPVRWYVMRRKPYVEITNFRQRIRKDSPGSRFPGPSEANEETSESDPLSSDPRDAAGNPPWRTRRLRISLRLRLRGILFSRYTAACGIDHWSTLPGYCSEDAEARYREQQEQLKADRSLAPEPKRLLKQLEEGWR